jgi:hypothetical protein
MTPKIFPLLCFSNIYPGVNHYTQIPEKSKYLLKNISFKLRKSFP